MRSVWHFPAPSFLRKTQVRTKRSWLEPAPNMRPGYQLPTSGDAPLLMQQASTPRELVDTPSAIQQTTCIEKNGKPCPEWLQKLIGQYPPIDVSERWNGQLDHFFTIGNGRRALHPDKKSWILFTAAHAGMWASTVVAVRNYRTSKEEGHSEFPAVAFMTGFDLLAFKTLSPAISIGPPVDATIHYSRAAARK